jgi:hypothetical protein
MLMYHSCRHYRAVCDGNNITLYDPTLTSHNNICLFRVISDHRDGSAYLVIVDNSLADLCEQLFELGPQRPLAVDMRSILSSYSFLRKVCALDIPADGEVGAYRRGTCYPGNYLYYEPTFSTSDIWRIMNEPNGTTRLSFVHPYLQDPIFNPSITLKTAGLERMRFLLDNLQLQTTTSEHFLTNQGADLFISHLVPNNSIKPSSMACQMLSYIRKICQYGGPVPIYDAPVLNDAYTIQLLVKGGRYYSRESGLSTKSPLCRAAAQNLKNAVYYLIQAGADVRGNDRRTPLTSAAKHGNLDVVRLLVKSGAPVDGRPDEYLYSSPLKAAVRYGHLDVVKYLLEQGAKPNNPASRMSPLAVAVARGFPDIVSLLIQYGADVATDEYINSPANLKRAVTKGYFKAVSIILNAEHQLSDEEAASISWLIRFRILWPEPKPLSYDFTAWQRPDTFTAEIRTRDRYKTWQLLRSIFISTHQTFIAKSSEPSASIELTSFGDDLMKYRKVWKYGIDAIYRLQNGELPNSLEEVFGCIQIANAMRLVGEELVDTVTLQASQEQSWTSRDE